MKKGWILYGVLTCKETLQAALELVNEHLDRRPVVAVIYSHSHVDHFGGIRGVVDLADVESSRVQLLAPIGFMKHSVAENVYSGNAMNRRAFINMDSCCRAALLATSVNRSARTQPQAELGRSSPIGS